MTELEVSLTNEELVEEVRNALAGLDGAKVPDDTIIQTTDRFVVPLVNDVGDLNENLQESFDNVVIAWTAEMSFGAWLTFTRLRDREIETFIDPGKYQQQLEKRTNMALRQVGGTRPPEVPSYSIAIKHDGVNRTVDLRKVWEIQH